MNEYRCLPACALTQKLRIVNTNKFSRQEMWKSADGIAGSRHSDLCTHWHSLYPPTPVYYVSFLTVYERLCTPGFWYPSLLILLLVSFHFSYTSRSASKSNSHSGRGSSTSAFEFGMLLFSAEENDGRRCHLSCVDSPSFIARRTRVYLHTRTCKYQRALL